MEKLNIKIKTLNYHRNGVCGEGFYTGILNDSISKKLFVYFPNIDKDGRVTKTNPDETVWNFLPIRTAILDAELVGENITEFGENSWRGDHYSDAIFDAIKKTGH